MHRKVATRTCACFYQENDDDNENDGDSEEVYEDGDGSEDNAGVTLQYTTRGQLKYGDGVKGWCKGNEGNEGDEGDEGN